MATPITWRNINAPSFSDSNNLFLGSAGLINQGGQQLLGVADSIGANNLANYQVGREQNTQNALAQLQGLNTQDSLNDAISSGLFSPEQLQQQYGAQIDQEQINLGLQARESNLFDQAIKTRNADINELRNKTASGNLTLKQQDQALKLNQSNVANQIGLARSQFAGDPIGYERFIQEVASPYGNEFVNKQLNQARENVTGLTPQQDSAVFGFTQQRTSDIDALNTAVNNATEQEYSYLTKGRGDFANLTSSIGSPIKLSDIKEIQGTQSDSDARAGLVQKAVVKWEELSREITGGRTIRPTSDQMARIMNYAAEGWRLGGATYQLTPQMEREMRKAIQEPLSDEGKDIIKSIKANTNAFEASTNALETNKKILQNNLRGGVDPSTGLVPNNFLQDTLDGYEALNLKRADEKAARNSRQEATTVGDAARNSRQLPVPPTEGELAQIGSPAQRRQATQATLGAITSPEQQRLRDATGNLLTTGAQYNGIRNSLANGRVPSRYTSPDNQEMVLAGAGVGDISVDQIQLLLDNDYFQGSALEEATQLVEASEGTPLSADVSNEEALTRASRMLEQGSSIEDINEFLSNLDPFRRQSILNQLAQ